MTLSYPLMSAKSITGKDPMYENLTRLDLVGPALARALHDPGWERLEATLVSGGKSNLTFELTSDAEAAEDRRGVADVLVDTLADLHALDPDQIGLSGYGRPSGLGERQVRRWSDQWERSKSREVPAVDELARLLRADPPRGPGGAIVHGDFRIDNCLLGRQMPPTVQAVLDWELSTLGEPLADLGLFIFYWREPGDARPALTPAPTMQPGFPSRTYLAERYAARTGADLSDLSSWVALAHFKSAV